MTILANMTSAQKAEFLAAIGAAGAPKAIRRQVADRCMFPTHTVANSAANTQFDGYYCITVLEDTSDISLVFANVARSDSNANVDGPSDLTLRLAIYDGTTAWPLYWASGRRELQIAPGGYAETQPLAGIRFTKGQRIAIVRFLTYAAAPATFPGEAYHIYETYGPNASEAGTALTDKTLVPTTISGQADVQHALGALAIKGTVLSPNRSIALLGDSKQTWLYAGAQAAGYPYVNFGIASLSINGFLSSLTNRAKLIQNAVIANVGTLVCALWVNDALAGRTAAQIYADYLTLKGLLDPVGIRLIVTTPDPKTNATNDGDQAAIFPVRQALDALVRANNGVGYGYFDLAAVTQDSTNNNLWRADIAKATALSVGSGGSNYATNDLLHLGYGLTGRVSSVGTGGVVTGIAIVSVGGKPGAGTQSGVSPVPYGAYPTSGIKSGAYGFGVGSGATFNVTWTATSPTSDGTHPLDGLVQYEQMSFSADIPRLVGA